MTTLFYFSESDYRQINAHNITNHSIHYIGSCNILNNSLRYIASVDTISFAKIYKERCPLSVCLKKKNNNYLLIY